MPVEALALVLAAAALHATWNLLAKRARDPFSFLWLSMCLGALLLTPLALARDPMSVRLAVWPLLGSALTHGLYFMVLGEAYRVGDFSVVYPIARGLGVALAPLGAWLLLDDPTSATAAAGIALVATGIFALAGSARRGAPLARTGTALAVLTGVTIATYSLLDRTGVQTADPVAYLVGQTVGALVVSSPLAFLRRARLRVEWRESRRALLAASTLNLSGYLLVLFAFRLAATGYVVATREVSIVLAALLGRFVLGERVDRARAVSATVVAVGALVVALAP